MSLERQDVRVNCVSKTFICVSAFSSYLLHRCVFHSVCVVVVVDDFKVLDGLSFGRSAEVAVQVGLSCSFSAHSEMSGFVQLNA